MADFSTTNLGESPSAPSARSPVTTFDQAITQGIFDVAGAVSDLGTGFRARKATELAAAKYEKTLDDEEMVSNTIREVDNALSAIHETAIAEGVSSAVLESRLTKARVDALNNPNLDKATVVETFKTFRSGRGKESLEKTEAEKFQEEVEKRAVREGISTDTARAMLRSEYATANLLKRRQDLANLSEIERNRETLALDYNQADHIQAAAGAFTSGIAEDIRQNGEALANLPSEEGAARIRELKQSAIEFEKQLRASVDEGEKFSSTGKAIESQLALVENQITIYEDLVKGTTTLELANARLDIANAEDQLSARAIIESGPNGQLNRNTLGMVSIFGRNGIAIENLAMAVASNLYETIKSGTSPKPVQAKSLDTLVKTVENTPSYTSEEKKIVAQTLVDLSGELALYHDFPQHDTEGAGKNRQSILRAYAAPRVGKFLEANEVELPPSVKRRHKAMQSAHLHDVLIPAIERDFVRGVTIQKPGGEVEVKKGYNHAKLSIGSDGLFEFVPLDAESDPLVVRSLNNKVALLLNEWIRGTTHMIGSTDYKLWTQNPADVQAIEDLFKAAAE